MAKASAFGGRGHIPLTDSYALNVQLPLPIWCPPPPNFIDFPTPMQ